MANVGKRKAFSIAAEKHGVNAFSQNEIEHFECCDDDVITSGEQISNYLGINNKRRKGVIQGKKDIMKEKLVPNVVAMENCYAYVINNK
ncbi:hypothetical protein AVEN_121087-1 [Araneus ventricosus]|uniref:Uncharacterized protein n=1 Tax=Araneus ventricosus TaxID=182803 RepID=A0A4Y2KFV9_ARAVE|nr:hypothetical protein AVEN_121087-1 [Araneus ventricosus]